VLGGHSVGAGVVQRGGKYGLDCRFQWPNSIHGAGRCECPYISTSPPFGRPVGYGSIRTSNACRVDFYIHWTWTMPAGTRRPVSIQISRPKPAPPSPSQSILQMEELDLSRSTIPHFHLDPRGTGQVSHSLTDRCSSCDSDVCPLHREPWSRHLRCQRRRGS